LKSHLLRIYKNKKSMLIFWFILFLPLMDLAQLYNETLKLGVSYNPLIASFLTGSTQGHIGQMLLFWFLPIYLLIMCSDDYIQDTENGYNSILISKLGKKTYIRNKLLISFFAPGLTMLIALTLNLIMSVLLFTTELEGSALSSFFQTNWSGNKLADLSQSYPLTVYIVFLLNVSLMTGFAGLLGASISMIIPYRKYTYPLTFFVWFIQITLNNSIIGIFQPFTEYGFNNLLPILVRSLVILLMIPLISYIYKVKTDEL